MSEASESHWGRICKGGKKRVELSFLFYKSLVVKTAQWWAYLCRMYTLLVSLLIGLFAVMLFVNVYFRAKVLKTYGVLVRHRVQFGAVHVFNRRRMEEEILPRYPHCRREIETFVRHIRYTIRMATVLLVLITALGALLMYYR